MNVVIVGAGKSGLYLAQELKSEHDVTLIESRFDRSDVVAAMMPDVHVVHGDACETDVLEHAQIGSADLVIAATGDDEDNLVVAMLSKHFGSEKVFARINHPKNEWLFTKDFGVDVPVSSTSMMLSLVEKEVGFGDLITLLRLQADNVSIEEITLPPTASAVGKTLMDLSLPENCHVMAIITPSGELTIAKGDTLLGAGDELLLISDGQRDDEVCAALGVGKDAIVSAADAVASHEDGRRRLASGLALGLDDLLGLVVEVGVVGHVGDDDAFLAEELLLDPERRLVVQHRVGGVRRRVLRQDHGDDVVLGRARDVAHVVDERRDDLAVRRLDDVEPDAHLGLVPRARNSSACSPVTSM